MAKNVYVRQLFHPSYDPVLVSEETGLKCEDESLADQSQAVEADINTIVDRFMRTGVLPANSVAMPPAFVDVTGTQIDFQQAQEVLRLAKESFMALPAKVREKFENNVEAFYEYVHDKDPSVKDERLKQLREWGLAVDKVDVVPSVSKVEDVPKP